MRSRPLPGFLMLKQAALLPGVQLQPHQERVRARVAGGRDSILVAHGTGLGKGLTGVAAMETLRAQGRTQGPTLVLTPASLRRNFAESTIRKFTDSPVVQVDRLPRSGRLPRGQYYVASYERFIRDPERLMAATGARSAIFDEVHRARNPQTKLYKSLIQARPRFQQVIGLTASPVSNKPEDLITAMDVVHGRGAHGLGTPAEFRRRHVARGYRRKYLVMGPKVPYVRIRKSRELGRELQGKVDYVSPKEVEHLLPKRTFQVVDVKMSPHQAKLFNFAMGKLNPITRMKIERGLPVGKQEAQHIFSMITQARQVSNSVHTLDRTISPTMSAIVTPKLSRVLSDTVAHLKSTPDGQVMLYTELIHGGVDGLVAGLKARGIQPAVFIGRGNPGVTEEVRQKAVQDYLAGRKRVIVLSGAGAEGLSLGNTTLVQMVDGHFNPERVYQAMSRGRRLGGQAHRPQEQREVKMLRYRSVLPKNWLSLLRKREGTDEWIDRISGGKNEVNEAVRALLEESSR